MKVCVSFVANSATIGSSALASDVSDALARDDWSGSDESMGRSGLDIARSIAQ